MLLKELFGLTAFIETLEAALAIPLLELPFSWI
jgi:hypothetical protein